MTRAKQKLFITGHMEDEKGYTKSESQFIKSIPKEYLQYLPE
jgi:superfamily I DNA/RNA helicase